MGIRGSDVWISAACRRGLAAIVVLLVAQGAHAAAIFKCVDAQGAVAFQGAPCAAHAVQTEVEIRQQPLIDPDAPSYRAGALAGRSAGQARTRKQAKGRARTFSRRSRQDKQPVSYECRAADGEVFYRHSKCPASVPGDGIARFGIHPSQTKSRNGRNSRGGAWGKVPVKAVKISRSDACRAIDATAAAGRDGHARDEQVSVYEHDLGRDPCSGY